MDDLLMAIKSAGAAALRQCFFVSSPDEDRFFCRVFPGMVIAAEAEHMNLLKGIEN
jgi:hypothetical protein